MGHALRCRGWLAVGLTIILVAPALSRPDESEKPKDDKPRVPLPNKTEPDVKLPAALTKSAPADLTDLRDIQKQVKEIYKKVMPSVVCLQVGGGSGSGVIISEDGYILTAGHVSGTPERKCTVIFPDGKRVEGKTLGYNKGIDSGLAKITTKGKYPFVGLGDSGKLKSGQWCLTLGHPGGYQKGRTPVLRLGRVLTSTKSLIQTDCAIVGGDSGGPLFDLTGKVIGIHSRISWNIDQNIHVPVNTYKETWDDLVAAKEWGGMLDFMNRRRPQAVLGLSFDPETTDLKVIEVAKGGPADKAGFKVGDVLQSIDGNALAKRQDLYNLLGKKKPDDEVTVLFERGGETLSVVVKLGRRANP